MDGGGKSSLASALWSKLQPNSYRFSFPSGTNYVGKLIRGVFGGQARVDVHAMMWLFVAEAVDAEPLIQQLLVVEKKMVICDRHTAVSGLIYQTVLHSEADVRSVIDAAHLRSPDRIYILDVPADIALQRRAGRGEKQNLLYEPGEVDKIEIQRQKYLAVAKSLGARVLDGTMTTNQLVQVVLDDLDGLDED